jgi:hypothetical protein
VNRGSGRAVLGDLRRPGRDPADRAPAATLCAADTQDAGAEAADVKEFEVAISHLRVPKMA